MFCKNCGNEIADNSAFCSYCGQTVQTEPAVAPQIPQVAPNVGQYPPGAAPNPWYPGNGSVAPKNKMKPEKLVAIVGAAVAVVAVVVLLWIFVFGANDLEDTKWVVDSGVVLEFYDDRSGVIYSEYSNSKSFFEYELDGDKLIMYLDDYYHYDDAGVEIQRYRYELDDDKLVLTKIGGMNRITCYDYSKYFVCYSCDDAKPVSQKVVQEDYYGYDRAYCSGCYEELDDDTYDWDW